jgi:hypothetical protein
VLDLIQNCAPLQASDEASDIRTRGGERSCVIEGVIAVATAFADLQGEGGLSTLSRAVDNSSPSLTTSKSPCYSAGYLLPEGGYRQIHCQMMAARGFHGGA